MDLLSSRLINACNGAIASLFRRRSRLALGLFWALCINLLFAPAILAASDSLTRGNAYALGLLGLVVAGLAVYLTTVILQPERF